MREAEINQNITVYLACVFIYDNVASAKANLIDNKLINETEYKSII